jgi:superfamily I DNA/RNA helicase
LTDVRRVLDLAASLPGLRRVDLVTNYRCPRPVVERAVRLVQVNTERFAKEIRPRPAAQGVLALAPDPGDDLGRARRLLTSWYGREEGRYAVLARTNAQLAPYAAVALELGIPYQASEDGLLLDHPSVDRVLAEIEQHPDVPPSVTCARLARGGAVARAMAAWSTGLRDPAALRAAIGEARARRTDLRREDANLILATVHGTKGLELDHVACIGMDDGLFPSRRTLEDADDPHRALEEERRLAYVAWTRARRSLALVYDPQAPSVFLREAFSDAELGLSPRPP